MPENSDERFERGIDVLRALRADQTLAMVQSLQEIAPQLAEFMVSFAFGDVYARPELQPAQRQLVTLGALAAMGGAEPQLELHIDLTLKAGLSPQQIVEALVQIAVYAGFPRALNAVAAARRVFAAQGLLPLG